MSIYLSLSYWAGEIEYLMIRNTNEIESNFSNEEVDSSVWNAYTEPEQQIPVDLDITNICLHFLKSTHMPMHIKFNLMNIYRVLAICQVLLYMLYKQ